MHSTRAVLDGGNMEETQRERRRLWALALVYGAVMCWLLFGRSQFEVGESYWERVKMNISLEPLHTVRRYVSLLDHTNHHLRRIAFVNLVGNVVVFIPFGVFLPLLWRHAQSVILFLLCTVLMIAGVELVQLFTLRGICDIDDLLLNVSGALIGFLIIRFLDRRRRRMRGDSPARG